MTTLAHHSTSSWKKYILYYIAVLVKITEILHVLQELKVINYAHTHTQVCAREGEKQNRLTRKLKLNKLLVIFFLFRKIKLHCV